MKNTKTISPVPSPNTQQILSEMVANANKNLERQLERERQFQIKREREMVMKAKRDAENKCRNILQGR